MGRRHAVLLGSSDVEAEIQHQAHRSDPPFGGGEGQESVIPRAERPNQVGVAREDLLRTRDVTSHREAEKAIDLVGFGGGGSVLEQRGGNPRAPSRTASA